MGLDGVDLLLDVEQTFGIDISDEQAENATTVRQLHDLVVKLASLPENDSRLLLVVKKS